MNRVKLIGLFPPMRKSESLVGFKLDKTQVFDKHLIYISIIGLLVSLLTLKHLSAKDKQS